MKISELIKERIKKIKIKNWNGAGYMIEELEELLPKIEAIEKEQEENSLEKLSFELKNAIKNLKEIENEIKLKEKLTTN